jgi:hypothetical protein
MKTPSFVPIDRRLNSGEIPSDHREGEDHGRLSQLGCDVPYQRQVSLQVALEILPLVPLKDRFRMKTNE